MNAASIAAYLAAAIVTPFVVFQLHRSVTFGIHLFLAVLVVDTIYLHIPPINAGFNVYVDDVVTVLLVSAGALRIFANIGVMRGGAVVLWILFLVFIAYSSFRGVQTYGTSAVVESRVHWYYWGTVFYFMTFGTTEGQLRRLLSSWMVAGVALSLLVVARWGSDAVGLSNYSAVGAGVPLRVVEAQISCFIAFAAIIALFLYLERPKVWLMALVLVQLVIIVLLQHRSAWTAALAGVTALLVMERKRALKRASLATSVSVAVASLAAVVLFFTPWGGDAVQRTLGSFSAGTDLTSGTAYDRLAIWNVMIAEWTNGGTGIWLFGFPYGLDNVMHYVVGTGQVLRVGFSAHNFYVQILYNTGLCGLTLAVGAWLTALARMFANLPRSGELTGICHFNQLLIALLIGCFVFFLTYQGTPFQGLLFGVAVAAGRRTSVSSRATSPTVPYLLRRARGFQRSR